MEIRSFSVNRVCAVGLTGGELTDGRSVLNQNIRKFFVSIFSKKSASPAFIVAFRRVSFFNLSMDKVFFFALQNNILPSLKPAALAQLRIQVAGAAMSRRNLLRHRCHLPANRHRMRAARMKMAAAGRLQRAGQFALDGGEVPLAGIDARHFGQQRLGLGMVRPGENLLG